MNYKVGDLVKLRNSGNDCEEWVRACEVGIIGKVIKVANPNSLNFARVRLDEYNNKKFNNAYGEKHVGDEVTGSLDNFELLPKEKIKIKVGDLL